MAKEVLMLHLYGMEEENLPIPSPSTPRQIKTTANESAILIEVFMVEFREKQLSKFVKKTLSIPAWMNTEAERRGINFSQTLQEALRTKLKL